jgi:hypothetical protein
MKKVPKWSRNQKLMAAGIFATLISSAFAVLPEIRRPTSGAEPKPEPVGVPVSEAPAQNALAMPKKDVPKPVKPKAAPTVEPAIIKQHSEGPNSPNIVGDNNQVIVGEQRLTRRLSPAQKHVVVGALAGFPKPNVKLLIWPGGPEVENFKADFLDVFSQLNWPIVSTDVSIMPARDSGLAVVVSNPVEYIPAAGALFIELQKMGFKIVGTSDGTLQKDEFRFVVAPAQ